MDQYEYEYEREHLEGDPHEQKREVARGQRAQHREHGAHARAAARLSAQEHEERRCVAERAHDAHGGCRVHADQEVKCCHSGDVPAPALISADGGDSAFSGPVVLRCILISQFQRRSC